MQQRGPRPHNHIWSGTMTTTVEKATDQLWERWPALSREQRMKQFRELHTGEKADFFLEMSAHDQSDLLQDLPQEQRHVWMRLLAPDDGGRDPGSRAGTSRRISLPAGRTDTQRSD